MTLSINKALLDLSKLEPLDGTKPNYKRWSQKLLIFFEQLEIDYVLFSDLTEGNNASEISAASPDGTVKDKSKSANKAILKEFEKGKKTVKRHLLIHMTNPSSICLLYLNMSKSYRRYWRSNTELMMLKKKKKYVIGE